MIEDHATVEGALPDLVLQDRVLRGVHFEDVHFTGAQLEKVKLADCRFVDCRFEGCSLVGVSVPGCTFNGVRFQRCRMMGIAFADLRQIIVDVGFTDCALDYSVFTEMTLLRTRFVDCRMREVDLSHCRLDGSVFTGSDLLGANLNHASLMNCDLRGADNVAFDPKLVKLGRTKVDLHLLVSVGERLGLRLDPG